MLYGRGHVAQIESVIVAVGSAYRTSTRAQWRRCDTLCTSGFMDGVMFAHNGQEYAYPQSDSTGGSTDLTPRRMLILTY